jgi:ABC-2 type transport system ATP-binding protein
MTAHPDQTPAIQVRGLRKSYGKQVVLDGIDLDVPEGTVFALLGPNGAGKTTAIHILATLIPADAGQITIGGHDLAGEPEAVRHSIALTGQVSAVDGQFTGEENLRLIADLHHLGREQGRRRVAELLERFDLVDAATKPAMTYSGGMRRRLDLAMTLVVEPRIIFLDEPTTGLDPQSRRQLWDVIRDFQGRGRTVLLTTHYVDEAEARSSRRTPPHLNPSPPKGKGGKRRLTASAAPLAPRRVPPRRACRRRPCRSASPFP